MHDRTYTYSLTIGPQNSEDVIVTCGIAKGKKEAKSRKSGGGGGASSTSNNSTMESIFFGPHAAGVSRFSKHIEGL